MAMDGFGVVGCEQDYNKSPRNGLLKQAGEVLEVTPTAVLLKRDNGAKHWWGHGAFILTVAEVDARKVSFR